VALDKVADLENIVVDEAELKERVSYTLESLKDPNIDPLRLAGLIREEIKTEVALKWLIDNSEIELVEAGSLKPEPESLAPIESESDGDVITVEATSEEA
jgi:trigger factor